MKYAFSPRGVCSRKIEFELEDGIVRNVAFTGGCNGNLKAVSILTDGMSADEAIAKLQGITCGDKATSCPDQFAHALMKASEQKTGQGGR